MPFLERHLPINNIINFLNFRIMENVERIYGCDIGDNDNALTAANTIISAKWYLEYIKNNTSCLY